MKVVAVDFDGVIHKYSKGWGDGSIYDVAVEGASESLEKLVADGWKVIIFTTRLNPEVNEDILLERNKMMKWLHDNGIILNRHFHEITAVKPSAKYYIDDKGIRFTDWEATIKFVSENA